MVVVVLLLHLSFEEQGSQIAGNTFGGTVNEKSP